MSNGSALRNPRAAATASDSLVRTRPAARLDSPGARLDRLSARLDELTRDVKIGARSHRETERLVDEAEAIASELRAIFRAPTAQQPPLRQNGGRAWW